MASSSSSAVALIASSFSGGMTLAMLFFRSFGDEFLIDGWKCNKLNYFKNQTSLFFKGVLKVFYIIYKLSNIDYSIFIIIKLRKPQTEYHY